MKLNRKHLTCIAWSVIIFAGAFTMEYLDDMYSSTWSLLFGILVIALFASYLFILVRTSKAYRRFRGYHTTQSGENNASAPGAMNTEGDAGKNITPPDPEIR